MAEFPACLRGPHGEYVQLQVGDTVRYSCEPESGEWRQGYVFALLRSDHNSCNSITTTKLKYFMYHDPRTGMWPIVDKVSEYLGRELAKLLGDSFCLYTYDACLIRRAEQLRLAPNSYNINERRAIVLDHLARQRREFVDPPRLLEWEQQFSEIRDRYKFYVLTGRSGMGKTTWASAYFARKARSPSEFFAFRKKMLLLTCTTDRLPPIGQYRNGHIYGIVYDEGTPQMVLSRKEIFQSRPELCTIRDARTPDSTVNVCFSGCRQIITCNDWWERINMLTTVERNWFTMNAIVADVDVPLYKETPLFRAHEQRSSPY